MATARSPSPNPSRAKTPDGNNFLRKSTTSSFPSKPSFSIDPQLRSSCSKDPFDHHSKENKPTARARSPAVHAPRASKSFMAPTISAASKVAAPSPRKKILQERNHEVSSSISSDSLEEVGVLKSNTGLIASPEIFSSNYEIKNTNSVAVPSFSSASPAGADPPPYDPKTNYLSPRPQFLHYRPNPRIENYVGTEGDGKRLEDSFSSESEECGGAVAATEEKDSEEEEYSSPSIPSEVEEEEGSGVTRVAAEPEPESEPSKPMLSRRSKLVPILLVVAVAFVFMPLSDSPIIPSSSSSSSATNDRSFVKLFHPPAGLLEYRALASTKLHDLAGRFKHWSSDSVAYLISVAYSEEVGLVSLVNVTSLVEDEAIGSDFVYKHETRTKQGIEDELEVLEVASNGSAEDEAEEKEAEVSEEVIEAEDTKHEAENEAIEMEVSEDSNEDAEAEREVAVEEEVSEAIEMESEAVNEAEENVNAMDTKLEAESEAVELEASGDADEDAEAETEVVLEEASEAIEMESEAVNEVEGNVNAAELAAEEFEIEVPENGATNIENVNDMELTAEEFETEVPENGATNIEENHQGLSHIQPASSDSSVLVQISNTSSRAMMGLLSSALLLLVAVAASLYMKQKRRSSSSSKKKVVVVVGGSISDSCRTCTPPTKGKGSPPLQDSTDFVHSVASSGLDSTSPYQQTKRGEEEEDNLSRERRPRRDSTASSSVSYGSFTTYERLSAKKGSKDEEVATPVRRSSRLRSHVTSS